MGTELGEKCGRLGGLDKRVGNNKKRTAQKRALELACGGTLRQFKRTKKICLLMQNVALYNMGAFDTFHGYYGVH